MSGTQLQPGTFLQHISRVIVAQLERAGADFHYQTRGRLAKFWYGEVASIHYEVWLHERTNQLEIGLHFESAPEYNSALYKAFDRCLLEIQSHLGNSFWLEEWDNGWVRLYETYPLYPLEAVRVDELAARAVKVIGVLQPLYDDIVRTLPPPPLDIAPAKSKRFDRTGWRSRSKA